MTFGQTLKRKWQRAPLLLSGLAALLLSASSSVSAQQAGNFPGDTGKPPSHWGDGIPNNLPRPKGFVPQPLAHGPGIDFALKAAKTIVAVCPTFPVSVAVVDSVGFPILMYVPDNSKRNNGYVAIRKAYSAVVFKTLSSQMAPKAKQDPAFAAKVRADPNLVVFGGGIPLKVDDKVIGAVGVAGAEPGGHDEECGLKGLAAMKDKPK